MQGGGKCIALAWAENWALPNSHAGHDFSCCCPCSVLCLTSQPTCAHVTCNRLRVARRRWGSTWPISQNPFLLQSTTDWYVDAPTFLIAYLRPGTASGPRQGCVSSINQSMNQSIPSWWLHWPWPSSWLPAPLPDLPPAAARSTSLHLGCGSVLQQGFGHNDTWTQGQEEVCSHTCIC